MSTSRPATTQQAEPLDAALARVDAALRAMWSGDPDSYIGSWEQSGDVTLLGALGPVAKGWEAVHDTLRWVGAKFAAGGPAEIEHISAIETGDLACTVSYERRTTSLDGAAVHERAMRVTHVYRRSPRGQWLLIHRHADYAQPDPRQTA
jgi:ketosteroid isomerase-like protein